MSTATDLKALHQNLDKLATLNPGIIASLHHIVALVLKNVKGRALLERRGIDARWRRIAKDARRLTGTPSPRAKKGRR